MLKLTAHLFSACFFATLAHSKVYTSRNSFKKGDFIYATKFGAPANQHITVSAQTYFRNYQKLQSTASDKVKFHIGVY
jgi:hypothetical protein